MPYQYFPATLYNDILVTDILKKFKIADKVKRTIAVENYRVKEEDTPESLAYILYQDPTYSWIILMLNEIKDRNNEWPYEQEILDKIIAQNYSTSSVFITDSQRDFSLSSATRFVINNNSYDIKSVDLQLNKIVTAEKLSTNIQQNSSISFYKGNDKLHTGNKVVGKIVYEDDFSLHHFEDASGNAIDPRGMSVSGPYNETQTYLYKYIIGDDQTYVVSNFQYELNTNDKKRDILLLNPDYLQIFLSNITRMFENYNKNINVVDNIEIMTLNGQI